MLIKKSMFYKILIFIILMLIPIFILFTYSQETNINIIENGIQLSKSTELSVLLNQIDSTMDQLSNFTITLTGDSDIQTFKMFNFDGMEEYNKVRTRRAIEEKIMMQHLSNNWITDITVFSPITNLFITTDTQGKYDQSYFEKNFSTNWSLRKCSSDGQDTDFFVRNIVDPIVFTKRLSEASLIVEVRFSTKNIEVMLNEFKKNGRSDPFFYQVDEYKVIMNKTADTKLTNKIINEISNSKLDSLGSKIIKVNKERYMVNYVMSTKLNWYLIDYTPMNQISDQIKSVNLLFYSIMGLILVSSILAFFLLYRNVQIPISSLIKGVQQIKAGNFSTRIKHPPNSEFSFLFTNFNEMAVRIEELVENEYKQKILYREAILKQLQSQINSHFLYNCFAFIINMTKLKNGNAVIEMAYNLSDYYRYKMRIDKPETTLAEEINLTKNYLTIQALQINNLNYTIDIPEVMMSLLIPRLLIQPVIENAVIHGIEMKLGGGIIEIQGVQTEFINRIIVKDNGVGLNQEEIDALKIKMKQPLDDEMGCGIWNVNQRLEHFFGEGAGLTYESNVVGGLIVTFYWRRKSI